MLWQSSEGRLQGAKEATVFSLQSMVGKTATVAFEMASGVINAESG